MTEWQQETHEDYVVFVSPKGFRFEFNNYNAIFNTINCCFHNLEIVYTRHNERLIVERSGAIKAVGSDPWVNKGPWEFGYVASADDLFKVLLNYVRSTYGNPDNHLPELPR